MNYSDTHGRYEMPSHLFSCQGLSYLKLCQFKLSLPLNFYGFKGLLELHLIDIDFESGSLERLISGCPILNVLTISHCSGFDCIYVSVPSLKVLCIVDQDIKSICFKKAKNLTDLTLIMESHEKNIEQVSVSDFIKGLPNIERLCLSGYIKVELVIKEPELVIKSYSMAIAPLPDHLRALLYCNVCCLNQLQKVNITVGTAYEHALDLIRFLLANSSLEILTFKVRLDRKQSDTLTLLSISQDLLQMRRASQRAEVKFLYEWPH